MSQKSEFAPGRPLIARAASAKERAESAAARLQFRTGCRRRGAWFSVMQIRFFEIEPRDAGMFDSLKPGNSLRLTDEALSAGNAGRFVEAEIVSTFINSAIDRVVLDQLPALKLIATRSTGFDHIDTALCAERGILVCNVPVYGENTVAEHVFALLLALSHRLLEAVERARSGPFSPAGLMGFDLAGKTLGLVGTGAIGRHVVRIAHGFGMHVCAFDIVPDFDFAAREGFSYLSFDDLLTTADIISLHVPSTPQTRHLLSADAFTRMKDGVVIINTARGNVIDTHELIEALKSGKVAAAGLDVLPDEPMLREEAELICSVDCEGHDLCTLVADQVLLRMPNVIVTPHSAFNTREAIARIAETTVENIKTYLAGVPQNLVATQQNLSLKEQEHV